MSLFDNAGFWSRMRREFAALGPSYEDVPATCLRMFRKKHQNHVFTALLYYRNVLGVLRRLDLLRPDLAEEQSLSGAIDLIERESLLAEVSVERLSRLATTSP